MQTILKHCTAVLSRLIFIGFSVQIVLGILWMCNAFAGCNGPGEGIVCVGAMLLFGAAVWFAKGGISEDNNGWKTVFVVFSVMSFPFVMQSLMNPDVRLIVTSVLLFALGGVWRMFGRYSQPGKKIKLVGIMLGFWLLVVGLVAGEDIFRNGWTPVSTRLTERMVWTTLYDTYAELPQEVREVVNYHKMVEGTYEATGMRDGFIPFLATDLGEEKAGEVLAEFRSTAWRINKKQILKETVWDVAGYGLSPVVMQLQLAGRAYDSYTGMNYRELLQPSPKLGKIYTDYSCWWFGIALVAVGLVSVLRLFIEKKSPMVGRWIFGGITCAGMVVCYALDGAGRMDYKNALLVLCIWLLWMAGGVRDAKD